MFYLMFHLTKTFGSGSKHLKEKYVMDHFLYNLTRYYLNEDENFQSQAYYFCYSLQYPCWIKLLCFGVNK